MIYVFDYTVGQIFEIDDTKYGIIGEDVFAEDILIEHGHNPNDCNWMITDERLEIIR